MAMARFEVQISGGTRGGGGKEPLSLHW